MSYLVHLDHVAFLAINGLQGCPAVDAFFFYASRVGTVWVSVPLTIVATRIALGEKARRLTATALLLALTLGLLDWSLKGIVHRARPGVIAHHTACAFCLRVDRFSFPSGHALTAFGILGFFAAVDQRLMWLWLPCALLIDFSRVYLGSHFPSDVLAGSALGFGVAYGLCRLMRPTWRTARRSI